HQHFGSILVSCEGADLRPTSHGIHVYGDQARRFLPLRPPAAPRLEVIDELHDAVYLGKPCLHDGQWAKGTLEICLAMLASDRGGHDVGLAHQA
ncbi:gfo/Idh/MocA family oxidoreductase, partial [Bordetella hinzii]|nr:gfo/Idh/MocA family oxidoreductase [Bordetella hinzii]